MVELKRAAIFLFWCRTFVLRKRTVVDDYSKVQTHTVSERIFTTGFHSRLTGIAIVKYTTNEDFRYSEEGCILWASIRRFLRMALLWWCMMWMYSCALLTSQSNMWWGGMILVPIKTMVKNFCKFRHLVINCSSVGVSIKFLGFWLTSNGHPNLIEDSIVNDADPRMVNEWVVLELRDIKQRGRSGSFSKKLLMVF